MGATQVANTAQASSSEPDSGIKAPSITLSQPKNYIGVPVAVVAARDTGALVMNHLTSMAGACKRGANAFGLITADGDVTEWFRGILSGVLTDYTPMEYLNEFKRLQNAKGRFIDQRPEWKQFGEAIARQYPATDTILDVLQRTGKIALPELVAHLSRENKSLVESLFLKDSVVADSVNISNLSLEDSSLYRAVGVCQFKTVLYHLGVLTTAGASTDYLIPEDQMWDVESRVSAGGWI